MSFSKIVIWGWPLHSHTHSYIHHSFVKAFKHMGFETLWLDDDKDVSGINFDNCLFITEGQVDSKIPHNKTSKYVLHNCDRSKYVDIPFENTVALQFFHKDVLKYETEKINDYTFVGKDIIYFCWGTDLLPHEIDLNTAHNELNKRECIWIGSYSQEDHSEFQNNTELDPFFDECRKNNIEVKTISPWGNPNPISPEQNRIMINQAFLAPSINGIFQKNTYYLPCRLFKGISYGHLGISNNEYANKIFGGRLVYDSDPAKLFHKAIEKKESPNCIADIKDLMNEVKERHTYINRCQTLLDFFK